MDLRYLDSLMANMNFPALWRKWIFECVGTAMASVLVNGCLTDEFPIERGFVKVIPCRRSYFYWQQKGSTCLCLLL